MNTIADLIAEHSFFSGLERADLEFVAGCGRNVRFTTGERILSEGDPANAFYVLRTGRVALGFLEPGSGDVIVALWTAVRCWAGRGSSSRTSGTSTPTPSSRYQRWPSTQSASAPSARVTPGSAID